MLLAVGFRQIALLPAQFQLSLIRRSQPFPKKKKKEKRKKDGSTQGPQMRVRVQKE